MLYDPVAQLFISDHASLGSFTYAQVKQLALNGGTFTFMGVPVGSGRRIGIDRDLDFLSDGDETTTSPTNPDSDGDGFPDGYEVAHGSDPANASSTPTNTVAPTILGATLVFESSVLAKFRWEPTSEANSRITINDAANGTLIGSFGDRRFERHHVLVVRKLEPGRSYTATIDGFDPNLNQVPAVMLSSFFTTGHRFHSTHSQNVTLTLVSTNPNGTGNFLATFVVEDETHLPVQNASVAFRTVEWLPGQAASIASSTSTTNAAGTATFNFTSVNALSLHPSI